MMAGRPDIPITVKPMHPAFAYFLTADAEFKVVDWEDHLEVWRSDSRGRWRRRKTIPPEVQRHYGTLKKYEIEFEPWLPTKTIGGVDAGAVRDPAFMDREPNPVVEVRTIDGLVLIKGDRLA